MLHLIWTIVYESVCYNKFVSLETDTGSFIVFTNTATSLETIIELILYFICLFLPLEKTVQCINNVQFAYPKISWETCSFILFSVLIF